MSPKTTTKPPPTPKSKEGELWAWLERLEVSDEESVEIVHSALLEQFRAGRREGCFVEAPKRLRDRSGELFARGLDREATEVRSYAELLEQCADEGSPA